MWTRYASRLPKKCCAAISIAGERDLRAAVGVGQVRFDLDQQIFQVTLDGRYGFGTVIQVLFQSVEGFG